MLKCVTDPDDIYMQVTFCELQYLEKTHINLLKAELRLLSLKTQSVPRCKHFSSPL
jgi:hypothetical protein